FPFLHATPPLAPPPLPLHDALPISYLVSHEIDSAGLYAMVRGRLSHINGQPARQAVSKEEEVNALNRKLNLTWMDQLPADNHIVAGQWWGPEVRNQPWVSVEAQLANRLG